MSVLAFVKTCRAALAGEITVKTCWTCSGLSGQTFRQWFLDRLTEKINREDRRPYRRLEPIYQTALMRDAQRMRDIKNRVRVYQFETDVFRSRFSHLLSHSGD